MARASGPSSRDANSIHVLLVEDQDDQALRIRQMLESSRGALFEVSHAHDLKDALQMLQQGGADVLMLDLTLPEGKGTDALLRARVASANVPVVVMADEDDESMSQRSIRLGAQDYLIKAELSPQVLARTLRHAVGRHRILRDLTAAREREHYVATHDKVTGLPNRYAFQEHLRRTIDYAARNDRQVAVLFLGLDGFKVINDTLGHSAGDALLKSVAKRLGDATRRSDLVARIGGDEFVVTIQDVNELHAPGAVVEHIRQAFARPHVIAGRECWVTACIGVAVYPRDGADSDVLIRSADMAMHHAKSQGPNHYHFYQEGMNTEVARRFQLIHSLRGALSGDQLILYYQPQVDVGERRIVSAEALIRWQHPERGLVPPNDFIPTAEETGLILPIGEWVLRTACKDAARWEAERRLRLPIGVNVSSRQLAQTGFADLVGDVLTESGLPPQLLELEITETSVLHADAATRTTLADLRKLGVRIAMDDFGTGYSSLTLLKQLPVDCLKIDRSFVQGAVIGSADEVIVSGVVQIAKGLGIVTTGEGVETGEELRFLHAVGCNRMQGYLFGRPAPLEQFEGMLETRDMPWAAEIAPARG